MSWLSETVSAGAKNIQQSVNMIGQGNFGGAFSNGWEGAKFTSNPYLAYTEARQLGHGKPATSSGAGDVESPAGSGGSGGSDPNAVDGIDTITAASENSKTIWYMVAGGAALILGAMWLKKRKG